jgi:methylenetetrahydrofolate reductase (NADPH)
VPCIAHFTCRDLTPHEVENQLIDHAYFGIRNILALRGDPPDGQQEWKPREGGYSYAYQLIEQIKKMNEGIYLHRPGGPAVERQEPTDFCIGAACYPEHPDEEERIRFFKLKADAGAEYGITDMLFDPEMYAKFLDLCGKNKISIPILPATRVLKSKQQAERMMKKFRVRVPQATLDLLPDQDSPDSAKIAVEIFMGLVDRLKELGAPGIHMYVIADTAGAVSAMQRLAQYSRTK